MGRHLLAAGLLAALLLAGCYAPPYEACRIRCGSGDACPSGQTCGDDGYCHGRDGEMCLPTFAQVAVGVRHTCAVKSDGTLWCWGANASGQVGDGSAKPRGNPAQVGDDTDWNEVAAGDDFTCAVRTDHTLWCWGDLNTRKVFAPEPSDAGVLGAPRRQRGAALRHHHRRGAVVQRRHRAAPSARGGRLRLAGRRHRLGLPVRAARARLALVLGPGHPRRVRRW